MKYLNILSLLIASVVPVCAASSAWLGFTFENQSAAGRPCSLAVIGVQETSGAFRAGVKPSDLVIQLDSKPIASIDALKARVQKAKAGDHLKIGLLRQGKFLQFDAILTARPDDIRNLVGSHVGSKAYALEKDKYYANQSAVTKVPKAILLDFWATWCGPCRASIPMLRDIYARFKPQGLMLVGVSNDRLDALQSFQKMEKEPWPLYNDVGGLQSSRWGVRSIPSMILCGGDWVVRRQWFNGPPSQAELDEAIRKVLSEK